MEFKAFSFYVEGILLVSEGHALNVWICRTRGKKTYLLPTAGYHRVCGPGGQCCHYLLVLEEEEHLPPADDDAGGVRLRLHHHQCLHIQPPQDIQEVRVCKPPLPYIFPASKMFFSQKQISFMSSTEDRNTSILYLTRITIKYCDTYMVKNSIILKYIFC